MPIRSDTAPFARPLGGLVLDAAATNPRGGGASFSLRNRLTRIAWTLVWAVTASWTPRQLAPWRRALLRAFGARMAAGSDVRGSARIWLPAHLAMDEGAVIGPRVNCYNMAPIAFGRGALVSQGAHLCAGSHDIASPDFQLVARPISVGAESWIAAEAFVGPGVTVGEGTVLG
ncbi:MAG: putative colanic acid biosynthesis acetyltransferase, partial [Enterovirga sp.]|nr:putative colanic acid biosynthesis acetyltransferase [Enterovirga sp.]